MLSSSSVISIVGVALVISSWGKMAFIKESKMLSFTSSITNGSLQHSSKLIVCRKHFHNGGSVHALTRAYCIHMFTLNLDMVDGKVSMIDFKVFNNLSSANSLNIACNPKSLLRNMVKSFSAKFLCSIF